MLEKKKVVKIIIMKINKIKVHSENIFSFPNLFSKLLILFLHKLISKIFKFSIKILSPKLNEIKG